jgi:hypothetical protein
VVSILTCAHLGKLLELQAHGCKLLLLSTEETLAPFLHLPRPAELVSLGLDRLSARELFQLVTVAGERERGG